MAEVRSAAVAMALVGIACVGVPVSTYPGAERSPSEVAVLRQTSRATVMSLDQKDVSGGSWAMLPGSHDALLRVRIFSQAPNVHWTVWAYCRVRFEVAAGKQYESVVRVTKETAPGLAEKLEMEIGIADAEGTLLAKAHSCTGKRPRRRR